MIGMPVYNGARYLRKALDSLLEQSFTDFRVIVLDDASSDESLPILKDYARRDSRISVFRSSERGGLIGAWNKVAQLAGEEGAPEYFAWYSDHDWVAGNWLESQLKTLQQDQTAVLATVPTQNVDENGAETGALLPALETFGLDRYGTIRAVTIDDFGAGNAVYGLFRYASLKRRGFLPNEILPDRILVSGMVLEGAIRVAEGTIRYRRLFPWNGSLKEVKQRQLKTLFDPLGAERLALRFDHGVYFFRRFLQDRSTGSAESIPEMERLVHAYLYLVSQLSSEKDQWLEELDLLEQDCDAELQWLVRFLASDTQRRFFGYRSKIKLLRHSLHKTTAELETLRQRLSAEVEQRKNLEAQKDVLGESLHKATDHLETVKQRLSAEVEQRKNLEAQKDVLGESLHKTTDHLETVKQRLSEEIERRKNIEAEFMHAKHHPLRFLFANLFRSPKLVGRLRDERQQG
jgi:glycosyltransferase involved in cell wall biosynthesis